MNTAEQILVVILGAALAVFLILGIVIAVQIIRLARVLNTIALKAQDFIDSAGAAADMVKNTMGQLSVLRFVHSVFDMVMKHKSNKNHNEGDE